MNISPNTNRQTSQDDWLIGVDDNQVETQWERINRRKEDIEMVLCSTGFSIYVIEDALTAMGAIEPNGATSALLKISNLALSIFLAYYSF